jgi:two-component system sensor histidine kinase RegB
VILSNIWLSRRAESSLIAWMFVLDTLALTAILLLTGGPTNPFTLLYLVNITLSATILNQRQTWAIGALASLCFGLLFWKYRPIAALEMHHMGTGVNLHLIGMWAAFAIASLLVAMFSGKISALLRQNEESLLRMQEELGRKDRLASLVTLAAGAAHELSTPLGTIAIVANDLERYATATLRDSAVAEDSRLIRTEVDRCSAILRRLSMEGAEPAGEAFENVAADELLGAARHAFAARPDLVVEASEDSRRVVLKVPRHAVEQALVALVKNAVEAGVPGSPVSLQASREDRVVRFEVRDRGEGMSLETLRHAGEPFFTTKEPGKGMGLGIFLVRTLADRLGGRLTYQSSVGAGTTAVLEIPVAN